jgi:glycosyltransferase involved in cell wall biosynthesis
VETRLRQLVASGQVQSTVVAPVPWFPFTHSVFGRYSAHARAPRAETRHGLEILHPRFLVLPKVGVTLAPFLLYRAVLPVVECQIRERAFDLIDAHYFYPDGVAAVMLGRRLNVPVVVTARGTDINLIAEYRLPRRMIRWAARHAAAVIAVSRALKEKLVALGTDAERVHVLRNGVDRVFRPRAQAYPATLSSQHYCRSTCSRSATWHPRGTGGCPNATWSSPGPDRAPSRR